MAGTWAGKSNLKLTPFYKHKIVKKPGGTFTDVLKIIIISIIAMIALS